MKRIVILITSLLAVSNAFSIQSKRQSSGYVTDGGFESVPKADVGKYNFNGGGWTFMGTATLYRNAVKPNEENTPYGKQFAHIFDYSGAASGGTITQQISGLPTGSLLTLSYRMRQWMPPYAAECDFSITLGSQTIQSYTIVSESSGQIHWSANAKAFKSSASSGALKFSLSCGSESGEGYDIQFDNISITG